MIPTIHLVKEYSSFRDEYLRPGFIAVHYLSSLKKRGIPVTFTENGYTASLNNISVEFNKKNNAIIISGRGIDVANELLILSSVLSHHWRDYSPLVERMVDFAMLHSNNNVEARVTLYWGDNPSISLKGEDYLLRLTYIADDNTDESLYFRGNIAIATRLIATPLIKEGIKRGIMAVVGIASAIGHYDVIFNIDSNGEDEFTLKKIGLIDGDKTFTFPILWPNVDDTLHITMMDLASRFLNEFKDKQFVVSTLIDDGFDIRAFEEKAKRLLAKLPYTSKSVKISIDYGNVSVFYGGLSITKSDGVVAISVENDPTPEEMAVANSTIPEKFEYVLFLKTLYKITGHPVGVVVHEDENVAYFVVGEESYKITTKKNVSEMFLELLSQLKPVGDANILLLMKSDRDSTVNTLPISLSSSVLPVDCIIIEKSRVEDEITIDCGAPSGFYAWDVDLTIRGNLNSAIKVFVRGDNE